jgi:hypothetical protein
MVTHEKAERILPGDKSLVIIHQDRSDTAFDLREWLQVSHADTVA